MAKKIALLCLLTLILALLAGCRQNESGVNSMSNTPLTSGIDRSNMDQSVRPQDDFFSYVNGTWLRETEIPADQTSAGGFRDLREKARADVLAIIQDLANRTDIVAQSEEQKVADMYNSFMDSVTIEAAGISPLPAELDASDALDGTTALSRYFAHARLIGSGAPFVPYVAIDAKDATRYATHIWQSGLGLPDRDYYFRDDDRSQDLREAYVDHITQMFTLAGWPDAAAAAHTIMALETRLAEHHRTNVANRDSEARYNKIAVADLDELGSGMDWSVYWQEAGIPDIQDIIVNQPDYIEGFTEVLRETPLHDWKVYLKWNLLNSYAGSLSHQFDAQNFAFYNKTLNGQAEPQPRWKRGVDTASGSLGEVIGKIYVKKHFTAAAKERMVTLVENLRDAYGEAISDLTWMTPATKQASLAKLAAFTPKIGYPDIWQDYSDLTIEKEDLVGNLMRATKFEWQLNVAKLGGPIRQYEWGMTPQTVNAYYSPNRNEIVFPAAILQPPFFNMAADDAVNYGAIGAVIGHEMGHGFDDQGAKYDGQGNLRNWWTDQDLAEFKNRTDKLVTQYAEFAVFPDLNVNGELTLGENIGDLSGVTIAWRAYHNSLRDHEAPVIDGLTGDERFFLGYGQVWRSKSREEAMRNRVATDPHSPPKFRVLGVLSNLPAFYETFGVSEGDAMYRPEDERVKVW